MTLYELDKDYFDSAVKRFKEYQGKYPLVGDTSNESSQGSLF